MFPLSESTVVTLKPLVAPVVAEFITRRAPLASLTMVALTPAVLLLILSRMVSSVSVDSTVMSTDEVAGLFVNVVPDQDPNSMVKVPDPKVLVDDAKTVLETTD